MEDPAAARALGFSPKEIKRAAEQGIDLGLLAENLRLSPEECSEQHDAAVRQVLLIQQVLAGASHAA